MPILTTALILKCIALMFIPYACIFILVQTAKQINLRKHYIAICVMTILTCVVVLVCYTGLEHVINLWRTII